MRTVWFLVAIGCALASAQKNPPADRPTFQSNTDLVLVPVVVRDAHGRAVGGLTKDDFQVFDKGRRQTVASFSVVRRTASASENAAAPPPVSAEHPPDVASAPAAADLSSARHLLYLFDDRNTDAAIMATVRAAAIRHFQDALSGAGRAAIQTVSGNIDVDFTSDRSRLEEAVNALRAQLTAGHGGTECPEITYFLADAVLNKGDQRAHRAIVQRTIQCAGVPEPTAEAIASGAERRELFIGEQDTRVFQRALRNAIQRLARMPGTRVLVLASPGFFMRTEQGIRAMSELLAQATRANVVINALDVRGLYTLQPGATELGPPPKLWQDYRRINADADKDVMRQLTEGTGGDFFDNHDDLRSGLDRLAAAPEFSYVLGFSPSALKTDGSYHPLRIRLAGQSGLSIEARHGYYALKPQTAEQAARAEIDDSVFSRDEAGGIPVGLQTVFSKPSPGLAKLTVLAIVDMRSLHFEKSDGRNRDSLTLVSALFDRNDRYVTGTTKTVNLRLHDRASSYATELTTPFQFDVKPGAYRVRLVVREAEGTTVAACNGAITIP